MLRNRRRPRVLTWHVRGNYLYDLTRTPQDFYIVTKPDNPLGYAGKVGVLPRGDNVHEISADDVADAQFDVVLYQHQSHWEADREQLLSPAQQHLPRVYIEHGPPHDGSVQQWHRVDDSNTLLVHVTHFNRLIWDSGVTPTR